MNDMENLHKEMHGLKANKEIFEQVKSYAYDYMDNIDERPVFPSDEALKGLDFFDEPLSDDPCSSSEILRLLHEYGSPATVAQSGGRYFGFVNGGAVPVSLAAKWLSDIWDQNFAMYVMSPIASQMEVICEKWLIDLFKLPEETAAGFVSGSSTAIICGLAAARNETFRRLNWDIGLKGIFGAPKLRIVLGEQAHASVFKALVLLGFGQEQIEIVPADNEGCMNTELLPKLDDHTIVIAQAGNVNSGAFDNFEAICSAANNANAWVHIDGAFGLWSAASGSRKYLTKGIENADSWSVDAHKTLNAPYDNGIILCKNRKALVTAMQASGSYLQYSNKRDGMLYTTEMSRRNRAVELWATLKFLGKRGAEQLIDELCNHAQYFAEQLKTKGFHILNEVVFNQVLVACDSPELTTATLVNIQKSGECWCGAAKWKGEPVIRVSVCSWITTKKDIDRSVNAFVKGCEEAKKTEDKTVKIRL